MNLCDNFAISGPLGVRLDVSGIHAHAKKALADGA